MRIKKHLLLISLLGLPLINLHAQNDTLLSSPDYPEGKVFGRIFANVYTGIGHENKSSAFEVRRAYFGYSANLNEYFSAEVKLDIGSPNDISEYSGIRRYAYFKTAALYYEKNKIYFKFGIIDIDHFDLQETWWGHRYIEKSFQDKHKFGDKADLGASFHYRFSPFISADITMMNGEGYSSLQSDDHFKTGLGVSIYPHKDLIIRVFSDLVNDDFVQSTLSTFLGYKFRPVTVGLEYNYKFNKNHLPDHDQWGYSSYISYQLNEKFELFGRYDKLMSNIPTEGDQPWNLAEDGSSIISGLEYQPVKGLKIALNYQDWYPYAANLDNQSYIFLNFEVRF